MLREHAPLIAIAVVSAVLFYLVFRNLRGLREAVDALSSQCLAPVVSRDAVPLLASKASDSIDEAPAPPAGPPPADAASKPANKRA